MIITNYCKSLNSLKNIKSVDDIFKNFYTYNINDEYVNLDKLLSKLNISKKSIDFDKYCDMEVMSMFVCDDKNALICYNDNLPYIDKRYVIAKELANLFINNKNYKNVGNRKYSLTSKCDMVEDNSSIFARELLIPIDMLYMNMTNIYNKPLTVRKLASIFRVRELDMKKRLNQLDIDWLV